MSNRDSLPYSYVRPSKVDWFLFLTSLLIIFLVIFGWYQYGQAFYFLPWLREPFDTTKDHASWVGSALTVLVGLILSSAVIEAARLINKHRSVTNRQREARRSHR